MKTLIKINNFFYENVGSLPSKISDNYNVGYYSLFTIAMLSFFLVYIWMPSNVATYVLMFSFFLLYCTVENYGYTELSLAGKLDEMKASGPFFPMMFFSLIIGELSPFIIGIAVVLISAITRSIYEVTHEKNN